MTRDSAWELLPERAPPSTRVSRGEWVVTTRSQAMWGDIVIAKQTKQSAPTRRRTTNWPHIRTGEPVPASPRYAQKLVAPVEHGPQIDHLAPLVEFAQPLERGRHASDFLAQRPHQIGPLTPSPRSFDELAHARPSASPLSAP